LGQRFEQAFSWAARAHAGQLRKGTNIPYIAHLMGVASLVLDAGGDEDLAIAGLLHDIAEDCGGTPMLDEVRARFGNRVANVVDRCTDTFENPKPEWEKRKREYLDHLRSADYDTRLVSTADKLHNARAILADYLRDGIRVFDRFAGKREGTLWYYRAVAAELGRAERNPLTGLLERTVRELDALVESEVRLKCLA
jgi:(p)ppGpp synthase/HD superfamily hydrolase